MTDKERLDYLEQEMKREPITLHNVETLKGPYRGLGLVRGSRTLREALDSMGKYRSTEPHNEH